MSKVSAWGLDSRRLVHQRLRSFPPSQPSKLGTRNNEQMVTGFVDTSLETQLSIEIKPLFSQQTYLVLAHRGKVRVTLGFRQALTPPWWWWLALSSRSLPEAVSHWTEDRRHTACQFPSCIVVGVRPNYFLLVWQRWHLSVISQEWQSRPPQLSQVATYSTTTRRRNRFLPAAVKVVCRVGYTTNHLDPSGTRIGMLEREARSGGSPRMDWTAWIIPRKRNWSRPESAIWFLFDTASTTKELTTTNRRH